MLDMILKIVYNNRITEYTHGQQVQCREGSGLCISLSDIINLFLRGPETPASLRGVSQTMLLL